MIPQDSGEQMNSDDYLSKLLTDGPPAARCELVRHLPSDDFGPRMLARLCNNDQAITVRGIAIADAAWARTSRRLQILAGVRTEHACELLAYGRHEGLAYFVHEQEGGPRLDTLLREHDGQLPLSVLLPIFAQLLLGVAEAHRRGVAVGGVRPQDVRVIPEGEGYRIRIRNLGMAAVLGVPAGRRGSTDHPSLYRAPEADVSERTESDVYSLGVLFIRMLTGPLPVSANDDERQDLLRLRLEDALADDPSVTDGLVTLMLEVTDPDLATRPRTATRLLEALLEVMPASELRLPSASTPREVEEDAPQQWPARQWTVLNEWGRPRQPTPLPRNYPTHSEPANAAASVDDPSSASMSAITGATVRVQPLVRNPARPRSMLRRIALGTGLSSIAAAAVLAITIGEPGAASPTHLPTTSLAALATADAEPAVVEPEATVGSTVFIESDPPGVLTIDGRELGSTPIRVDVTPGRHVVRVQAEGHQTWRSRVEIAAGQERRMSASLVRE